MSPMGVVVAYVAIVKVHMSLNLLGALLTPPNNRSTPSQFCHHVNLLSICQQIVLASHFRSKRARDQQRHVRTGRLGSFLSSVISARQNPYPSYFQRPQPKPADSNISRFPVRYCILQRYRIDADGVILVLGWVLVRRSPIIRSTILQATQQSAFPPNRTFLCGRTHKVYSSSFP